MVVDIAEFTSRIAVDDLFKMLVRTARLDMVGEHGLIANFRANILEKTLFLVYF